MEEKYENLLISGKLESIRELFGEEEIIPVKNEETNKLLIDLVLNKKTTKEIQESKKIIKESSKSIMKNIQENPNFLSYDIIYLDKTSVEFAMMAINECFKKDTNRDMIFSEKIYSDEIEKYYLHNLIINSSDQNQKPHYFVKFKDSKNLKFTFDKMKNDKQLSDEFCYIFENEFREKYGNSYTFEILTIKKGSRELLINSNVPEHIFKEFIDYINKNTNSPNGLAIGIVEEIKQKKNLTEIKFSANMIDSRGNYDFTNEGNTLKRGGMDYHQPKGWVRLGLNVKGKYDNGNDDWLAMNGNKKEWAVGFHGFKNIGMSLLPIVGNIISRPTWAHGCRDKINENKRTSAKYPKCGVGVYLGDKIEVCHENNFTGSCDIASTTINLAFQCRIRPDVIKIANYPPSKAYVVSNEEIDDYSKIRPYGILFKFDK